MTSTFVEVQKPGAQTQLQDLGRLGWQRFGVPVGGVMDDVAHRIANWLVGNADDCATLEMLLMGAGLLFTGDARIAVCGADLSSQLNGEPMPMGVAVDVREGAVLTFGRRVSGLRAYLAVRGGFAVPAVMGSQSTLIRGGFGGWQGRALKKGDRLPIGGAHSGAPANGASASASAAPAPVPDDLLLSLGAIARHSTAEKSVVFRTVVGEHWSAFSADAQTQFHTADFRIHPQSDRMGYRLQGPALALHTPRELISEGVTFGTIQVPPDGQPIVLMAERQTTGGYPKIAHVASVDLPLLAQMAPQESLRFAAISLEEAQSLYLQREARLALLRDALLAAQPDAA
jgi:antagonist of KipI